MRTITVDRAVRDPPTMYRRILSPVNLRLFHGQDAEIGEWRNDGTREISFLVDAGGSPLHVGSYVKAHTTQRFDGRCIHNTVSVLKNLVCIDSKWNVDTTHVRVRADIHVNLPNPLKWLAERFVERRATAQINEYVSFVNADS